MLTFLEVRRALEISRALVHSVSVMSAFSEFPLLAHGANQKSDAFSETDDQVNLQRLASLE